MDNYSVVGLKVPPNPLAPFIRSLSRRDSALRSSLASAELSSDETSRTAGRQSFAPWRGWKGEESCGGFAPTALEVPISDLTERLQ